MSAFTKAQNLEIARCQVAQYGQYDKYFDNWIEVRVTKAIRTSLGKAFQKDELAIACPEIRKVIRDDGARLFMTVWSCTTQCATSVEFKNIEILETPVTLNFVEG